MLIERAELMIREGAEGEFATVLVEKIVPLLQGDEGVKTVSFGRGVENPGKFLLLVEWSSMDAHTAFTQKPHFEYFTGLFAPFTTGGSMEHFDMG